MDYEMVKVPLSDIDSGNRQFQITTCKNIDHLRDAIRAVGMMHPPILYNTGECLIIISGFRRIEACRCLHLETIHARIIANASEGECAVTAIADNAFQRPLNIVEQAKSYQLLTSTIADPAKRNAMYETLGLSQNQAYIEKTVRINHFSETLRQAMLDNVIPLTIALLLDDLPEESGEFLTRLFRILKIGLNKQKEILDFAVEIAAREDTSPEAVFTASHLAGVINAADMTHSQKGAEIREYLRKRRYPGIHEAQERFNRNVKSLGLDTEMSLIPPKDFEGAHYTLQIRFQNKAEFLQRYRRMESMKDHPALFEILSL